MSLFLIGLAILYGAFLIMILLCNIGNALERWWRTGSTDEPDTYYQGDDWM